MNFKDPNRQTKRGGGGLDNDFCLEIPSLPPYLPS